jgi:uncharacterized protein YvpB
MSKLKTYVLSIVFAVVACTGCAADNNNGRTNVTTTVTTRKESAVTTTQEVVTKSTSATTRKTPTVTTTVSTIGDSSSLGKMPSKVVSPQTTSKESTTTHKKIPTISNVAEVSSSTTVQTTELSSTTVTTTTNTNTQADSSTTTKETTVTAEEPVEAKKVLLDVKNILQYPELSMGSSIVASTIVLNYYGFTIEKMDLLEFLKVQSLNSDYLENPEEFFLGSPENSTIGYGSSSVIKATIESYLEDNKITGYEVVNLTGSDFSDLYSEVDNKNPVIIWVTTSMKEHEEDFMDLPLADGKTFSYNMFNECVCLVGFNNQDNTVFICDPQNYENVLEYPKSTVENIYNKMGKQALVIHKS